MISFFTKNQINEINSLIDFSKIKGESNTTKNYLNLKRKRPHNELKESIKSIEKFPKKFKTNFNISEVNQQQNECEKEKSIIKVKIIKKGNSIKFQNFSKNIFSVIFTYLRIDDLLKIRNIGSHNIRLCVNELIKKSDIYLAFSEIKSRANPFMNYYDSINCQKYFLMNGFLNANYNKKSDIKIKYILYHQQTNKNYYLIHYTFYNYFCSSEIEIETKTGSENKNKKEYINLLKNVLFTLPEKDYYEKFQFLDEYKQSEVAIFSLYKILLYNLSTKQKEHSIYLSSSCDFVLYKKELRLLIAPNSLDEIEFFKIYSGNQKIKESIYNLKIEEEKCEDSESPIVLNFNDYIDNTGINSNNLICIFRYRCKKVNIFDCQLLKIIHEINSDSIIIEVSIDYKYLIVITEKKINYYSIKTIKFSFLYSFELNNICKIENIKYISILNSKYLNNMFVIVGQTLNKKTYKPVFLYLENKGNYNNFYYSLVPFINDINDYIYNDKLICTSFIQETKHNVKISKMKIVISHLNNISKHLSSDDIRKCKKGKNDYLIKEYLVNI